MTGMRDPPARVTGQRVLGWSPGRGRGGSPGCPRSDGAGWARGGTRHRREHACRQQARHQLGPGSSGAGRAGSHADDVDILPRLKAGFQLLRRLEQQVRFAVHRPGCPLASPRGHGVPAAMLMAAFTSAWQAKPQAVHRKTASRVGGCLVNADPLAHDEKVPDGVDAGFHGPGPVDPRKLGAQ